MNLKKVTAQAAIVGAMSVGALGLGGPLGLAHADDGPREQSCFAQFCHGDLFGNDHRDWRGDRRNEQRFDHRRWDQRGFDDGRHDHLPFSYRGHRVEPFFDNGRGAWGFWFLGSWFPL